jgi:hypothetical protein
MIIVFGVLEFSFSYTTGWTIVYSVDDLTTGAPGVIISSRCRGISASLLLLLRYAMDGRSFQKHGSGHSNKDWRARLSFSPSLLLLLMMGVTGKRTTARSMRLAALLHTTTLGFAEVLMVYCVGRPKLMALLVYAFVKIISNTLNKKNDIEEQQEPGIDRKAIFISIGSWRAA